MNDVSGKPDSTHPVLMGGSLPNMRTPWGDRRPATLLDFGFTNSARVCKNAIDLRCNIASHLQLENLQRVCSGTRGLAARTLAVAKVPNESAFRGTEVEVTVL